MRAQHLIHLRLPSWAFALAGIQNIRVQAQRLVDLAISLLWAAGAAADRIRRPRTEYCGNRIERGPGFGKVLVCPLRIFLVGT